MGEGNGIYLRWGKRACDLTAASLGVVLLSPLLLFCAILVRLTSRGPIFFRQDRPGLNSRPFTLVKFRTMREGSQRLGAAVVVPHDKRLTPVGAFLRRSKLDEIPQLINVLAGDMSLVGPRPRPPENMALDRLEDKRLLTLRPGLTSYATVYHHNEEEYCNQQTDTAAAYRELQRQKCALDGEYLKDVSFSTDLKLIVLTGLLVVVGIVRLSRPRVASRARAQCMLLDGAWFAGSIWLAYWLRFDGSLVDFQEPQRDLCLVLLPTAQLLICERFGIHKMVWRYINRVDAGMLVAALTTVSAGLLLLRLIMPPQNELPNLLSLPIGIIVLDYFLTAGGAIGLRCLCRSLYELERYYRPGPSTANRRVLVFGAGQDGLEAVLSMQRLAHTEIVGFVDDDADKLGCWIGGYRVLGSSEMLNEVLRNKLVTDLVICARSVPSLRLENTEKTSRSLGIRVHSLIAIEDLLASQRPPQLAAGMLSNSHSR